MPLVTATAAASVVAPSLNATVPVGLVAGVGVSLTVAVRTTGVLVSAVPTGDAVSAVVVGLGHQRRSGRPSTSSSR